MKKEGISPAIENKIVQEYAQLRLCMHGATYR